MSGGPFSRGRPWRDRETSPERNKVWKEPKPSKVPVVYYLSRDGHLEHPHFMEVALSSSDGLYLRDVIDRLDLLRGEGMADLYSWSSKRSYKNGFVWQDLSEDDLIRPAHGYEYVLKGSELLRPVSLLRSHEKSSFGAREPLLRFPKLSHDESRRNRAPWSSSGLSEYRVYKTDMEASSATKAADASTQTEDWRSRRRSDRADTPVTEAVDPATTELERKEISPPPSSSTSTEIISTENENQAVVSYAGERTRASAALIHLLSCGSVTTRDHDGRSALSHARTRGGCDSGRAKETDGSMEDSESVRMRLQERLELH
ncbi:protein SOSEKI 5-like [Zingiber officinale]|uniref:SOSEKI DIX-like domain-containing protein n=1 Tax=Zingiber officinale TaxID=94328 RepID=A0A8J5FQJ1_ZINOF|nr:protein SOSEKI 5-like [Zingiber officinale]XP_042416122.1 protein SOSEKI 5-like [Zingiber officinale]KAG6488810.1 hypothetical protein ZIOFF_050061 [Zingiber officinale]